MVLKAEREWVMGQYYDHKQYYAAARQYYKFLIDNYPRTPYAEQARTRLEQIRNEPDTPAQPFQVADAAVRSREIMCNAMTAYCGQLPLRTNAIGLALLVALSGCAGYRFGNQSLYPADIQTIRVPVFQSSSFRRDLGEQLTEAVVKEIEKRTPYKVVRDANADSVLIGRITNETKHLLIETREGDSREMEIDLVVNVRWVSRHGEVIRECSAAESAQRCRRCQRRFPLRPGVWPIHGHGPVAGHSNAGRADRQPHGSAVVIRRKGEGGGRKAEG